MKKIYLITSSFPYFPGEQFLETEVKYFAKNNGIQLTILPRKFGKGEKRVVDASIDIDDYLIKNSIDNKDRKPSDFIKFLFSRHFYQEISYNNLFNVDKLKSFIGAFNKYQKYYNAFDIYFKNKKDIDNLVIYTYWNNEITYALETLKSKYGYKLVSRIHGFDLYKEVRISNYMPLKSQFGENIDKIFTITQKANDYLNKVYGVDRNKIELSRLGVDDHNIISLPNESNILHIASCSNLTIIKRVDKIIMALRLLSNQNPHIYFTWTHIGSGDLLEELLKKANEMLGNLPNIEFDFKGHLDNHEVYHFYKNNKVDVFINVSKSEGVPVSIMEAMSCHIPIIAPNIGGISDMIIDGTNGFLLSNKCEVNEIVDALKAVDFYKKKEVRDKSYRVFLEKYNAKTNYEFFLNRVTNI